MRRLLSHILILPLNLIAVLSGTITTSDREILYLDQLNVGKNEHLVFDQPDSNASILLILNKQAYVKIQGILSSNGSIHLVSPGGIHITHTGEIHTSGFTASTLHISPNGYKSSPHGPWLYSGSSDMAIEQQDLIETTNHTLRLVRCFVDQQSKIDSYRPIQSTSLLDRSQLPNKIGQGCIDFQTAD